MIHRSELILTLSTKPHYITDTEAIRCLTDSLESKIHTAEHQLETQDKVVSVLQTSIREAGQRVSSNDVIDTSGEEIYTSKGQGILQT